MVWLNLSKGKGEREAFLLSKVGGYFSCKRGSVAFHLEGALCWSEELARISWPSILGWAQHLEDISSDFRHGARLHGSARKVLNLMISP